ncbi:ABC transporter ATP-binding protein [Aliarcobacter cryaerophilus]|uniref:ABC transporter ATP-binding protein n=1 Tax=Aliarcobacter cryaerophilus TaxID=28198 RepID=A0A2S9T1I2_9BACT|nr:ABC transporter ATP-binding protein [Aliarcobacter cryaerophilus]PRM92692.1 sugar ABC transporter ATP-binding protein [Aliarcobacter cryaerophilus]QNM90490.1 ABC transporter ATP-binding protein [Aliarcobacter cryaerophilus]
MNDILEVKNIYKSYRTYNSEIWRILSWFGIKHKAIQENYTLKNISFSIKEGEAIGIIGQNGAGKSTLLKIITGTLQATKGEINTTGKISAILELGMGFHPDLTGRQNAYHSAGLMGYTSKQIDAVISDIEDFAEIGEYFDYPVRTYSSGMQMRVAFAVATAYRPNILIIDEALSVGDSYFQHKSFDKIKKFKEQGTSLLFVSHDKASILALCDRAILIDKGELLKEGNPEEITDYYNALIAQKENSSVKQQNTNSNKLQTISGTGEATIEKVALYNQEGELIDVVGVGDLVDLKVDVKINKDISSLVLGYAIKDRLGQTMYGTNTWHTKQIIDFPKENDKYQFTLTFPANLGVGTYSIVIALTNSDTHLNENYEWRDLALIFDVVNLNKTYFVGSTWNEPKIKWIQK